MPVSRSLVALAVLLVSFELHAARYDVGGPRSTSNDDSCDIADLPAATLLLPYFEVDLENINGETTLFTVTNVTQLPRIARVTLWTDLAVPLVSFNVFLTGYDVQAINLRDVLTHGRIGNTGTAVSSFGRLGIPGNPANDVRGCQSIAPLTPDALLRLQRALTAGTVDGCGTAGFVHANAIGYATIDVVGACTNRLPTDPEYFSSDLRYDNVLIGDYQQVNPAQNFAQGGPMVHIRAVPEGFGGTTNLTRTFYGRFAQDGVSDRRQPLPSRFAARYIRAGTTSFQTDLKMWRELSASAGTCTEEPNLGTSDEVVFDEAENGVGFAGYVGHLVPPIYSPVLLAATGRYALSDPYVFAQLTNDPRGGWVYFNLDKTGDAVADQAWVITSMRAESRYSVDMNATAFGNGCSAPARVNDLSDGWTMDTEPIAPSPNGPASIFPTGAPLTNNDDSCDISMLPAATLLLPYFEVDLVPPGDKQTTLFTIVNVTNQERVARVTLWTDYGFPVITFNIYLTGYDVQAINLYDVIARGVVAPDAGTGTLISRKREYSKSNPDLDLSACERLPGPLDPASVARMQQAFLQGRIPAGGGVTTACEEIGGIHDRAMGYATIDVVSSCSYTLPTDTEYFTNDIRYDNVLTGDYQQVDPTGNHAQASPLVHIRAIPEGGTPASRQTSPSLTTNLERTFYGRIAPRAVSDARQPLPSTFAARWILGGPDSFNTYYKVWRDVPNGAGAPCDSYRVNRAMSVVDMVTFDENENVVTGNVPGLPATSLMTISGMPNGAQAGWTYFNLDRATEDTRVAQSWVTVSMRAQNRFSADFDAPALGNGCSPAQALSNAHREGSAIIGPRP
ncbi:MAG TPA: hypothetical protein VNI54_05365 [Thermoanaerobaculia bacterium]|nr:hypothetical protein [Thermoanaerobaculia bacterium]